MTEKIANLSQSDAEQLARVLTAAKRLDTPEKMGAWLMYGHALADGYELGKRQLAPQIKEE